MTNALVKAQSTLLPQIDFYELFEMIVGGGTLASYCNSKNLPYARVYHMIRSNDHLSDKYTEAMDTRDERTKQMLVGMITEMASFDPGEVFDDRGEVLPISQWPAGARAALSSYERDPEGSKVRFVDRLAAARLIGKELGIFQDKVKIEGKMSLADLVKSASEVGEK